MSVLEGKGEEREEKGRGEEEREEEKGESSRRSKALTVTVPV